MHRGSILPDTRPLTSSWGTLPRDLTTLWFARAKEGPFVPGLVRLARSSRPNPANYRPHSGRAACSPTAFPRPAKKAPQCGWGRKNRAVIQPPAPLRPCGARCHPFLHRLLLSRPLSLSACGSPGCLPIVSLSLILFLSSSVCAASSLSSLCLPVAPSLPVHSEASCPVSPFLASLPWPGFISSAHCGSPVCLRPSPSFLGDLRVSAPSKCKETKTLWA